MSSFKRWIATGTTVVMLSSSVSTDLHAQGHAYHDGQNATIPTEWAFGSLLILGLAVVFLSNGHDGKENLFNHSHH